MSVRLHPSWTAPGGRMTSLKHSRVTSYLEMFYYMFCTASRTMSVTGPLLDLQWRSNGKRTNGWKKIIFLKRQWGQVSLTLLSWTREASWETLRLPTKIQDGSLGGFRGPCVSMYKMELDLPTARIKWTACSSMSCHKGRTWIMSG